MFLDKGKDAENLYFLIFLNMFLDKGKDAENLRTEIFYFILFLKRLLISNIANSILIKLMSFIFFILGNEFLILKMNLDDFLI